MNQKRIVKPEAISGFAEYSPQVQLIAQKYLDRIRKIYELYGFTPIETPIVERLEVLLSKGGDTDKEMYTLKRLHAEEDEQERFGLHYDLTVPFARYVAQHFSVLSFPFKRYQIQDCWRGERPQEGRYRQFRQCDIDIVALDNLPLQFDADVPIIIMEVLSALGLSEVEFRISNRNVLNSYLKALGVERVQEATRLLDKLEKIGVQAVSEQLQQVGLNPKQVQGALAIAAIKCKDLSFEDRVKELGVQSEELDQALSDLKFVAEQCFKSSDAFVVDLSVTRGFDYYTGSVYEVRWLKYPELGSIAGGGRYDDLASTYINKNLPGVGMSVGFTRIFGKLVKDELLDLDRLVPTKVLIGRMDPENSEKAFDIAKILRGRGIPCEVYWQADKFKKQLQYANKKQIPFFVIDTDLEIKNLETGEQTGFDPETWEG